MKRTFGLLLLGWLGIHLINAAVASALPSPGAQALVYFGAGGPYSGGEGLPPQSGLLNFTGGGITYTGCATAVGQGFTSVCGIPISPETPAVAATAATSGTGGLNASAYMGYYVQIVGPLGVSVPLIIGGVLTTTAATFGNTGTIMGTANLTIGDTALSPSPTSIILNDSVCAEFNGGTADNSCLTPSLYIDMTANVQSNDILSVSLAAVASVSLTGSSIDNSASAFVDPWFEIDPAFPLADEFSINISPGIDNPVPSSVPEPPSLLLLGVGLVAIWFCVLHKLHFGNRHFL